MRSLNRIERAEIERQIAYITDDSLIAAYHNVPRPFIAKLRSALQPKRPIRRAEPATSRDSWHDTELTNRKTAAELANEAHVTALMAYFARHHTPTPAAGLAAVEGEL